MQIFRVPKRIKTRVILKKNKSLPHDPLCYFAQIRVFLLGFVPVWFTDPDGYVIEEDAWQSVRKEIAQWREIEEEEAAKREKKRAEKARMRSEKYRKKEVEWL